MFIKFECEKCKCKFKVTKNVLRKSDFTDGKNSFNLTLVDCPKCKHAHVVQIDNHVTDEFLSKIIDLAILAKNSSYPKMIKSYKDKAKKIAIKRDEKMSQLKKQYEGKIVKNKATNENIKVRFANYENKKYKM